MDRYLWLAEQFCGSLMACLFLEVFRLSIKFFGGFVATSAKIRGYLLRLGVYENENENENRLFGMAAMHAGFT